MVEGSIQKQDVKIANTYSPNITAPKFIKQILQNLNIKIYSDAIIVDTRQIESRQNTAALASNDILDQTDLTYV